jgi:hypothetical protein
MIKATVGFIGHFVGPSEKHALQRMDIAQSYDHILFPVPRLPDGFMKSCIVAPSTGETREVALSPLSQALR